MHAVLRVDLQPLAAAGGRYGLLAPAGKTRRLATARALLGMPPAHPATRQAVREFMQRVAGIDVTRCARCGRGRWQAVCCVAPTCSGTAQAGNAAAAMAQACRGPR